LTNENDLALMQVSPPFELNEFVSPVQLVKQSFVPSGEPMTVAGWGQLLEDGQLSNTLMKVDVPFVPQETCSALYGGTRIKDTMLCGGEGGKDACKGDSGGPLMCPDGDNYSLCGVVSFGTGQSLANSTYQIVCVVK
jgi:secreted trypsin-like serine protease